LGVPKLGEERPAMRRKVEEKEEAPLAKGTQEEAGGGASSHEPSGLGTRSWKFCIFEYLSIVLLKLIELKN